MGHPMTAQGPLPPADGSRVVRPVRASILAACLAAVVGCVDLTPPPPLVTSGAGGTGGAPGTPDAASDAHEPDAPVSPQADAPAPADGPVGPDTAAAPDAPADGPALPDASAPADGPADGPAD